MADIPDLRNDADLCEAFAGEASLHGLAGFEPPARQGQVALAIGPALDLNQHKGTPADHSAHCRAYGKSSVIRPL